MRARRALAGLLALVLSGALGAVALGVGSAGPAPKVTVDLTVKEVQTQVLGVPFTAWTFNGIAPGPIIRVAQGTELTIVLHNAHSETHSFHSHFQDYDLTFDGSSQTLPLSIVPHQNDAPLAVAGEAQGLGNALGVHPQVGLNPIGPYLPRKDMDVAPPGTSYTYRLVAKEVGVFLYHCHQFPVSEHIGRGLFGLIIVYPPGWSWDDSMPNPQQDGILGNTDAWVTDASGHRWYEDVVMLSELDPSMLQEKALLPTPLGASGKVNLLNMRAYNTPYYLGPVEDGTPMRVIVADIGNEAHSFHVHGHNFDVLDKFDPQKHVVRRADALLLGPGESYELTLDARHPGFWFVHDHMNQNAMAGMIGWLAVLPYE